MARRVVLASLLAAALAAVVVLVPVASGSSAAKYTVTAVDFRFLKMPKTVAAGAHTFTLVNRGQATHDLRLAGKKTRILNNGERAVLKVTLKGGKTYAFLCTVPGHAALGMKGKLVVKK
jgi:plastocyanin